jgi:outer membrane protein OmpA-like peptidoglycan-associated protein
MSSTAGKVALGTVPFLGLFAIALPFAIPRIENDRTDKVEANLAAAGIDGVTITFNGRDATLKGPADKRDAALAAIDASGQKQWGIRSLDYEVEGADASAAPTTTVSPATTTTVARTTTVAATTTAARTTAVATTTSPSTAAPTTTPPATTATTPPTTAEPPLPTTVPPIPTTAVPVLQGSLDEVLSQGTISFAPDSAELRSESFPTLDAIAAALVAAPGQRVEVRGHTDNTGTANQVLSERRAASAVEYLVDHGVPADELTSSGAGDTEPIASNDTPEGRAENRRIEFRVLEGG